MTGARELWERSFQEQIARGAYNTAPVEAVVRTLAYHFRDRGSGGGLDGLRFLEVGCGAGPNLVWLAERGARVSGIDISTTALRLARENLERHGLTDRIDALTEAPADRVPLADASVDGVVEACVLQHLGRDERLRAFNEIARLLRPGGVFVGYLLDVGHTAFRERSGAPVPGDPGTLMLHSGTSQLHLTDLGLCHFFTKSEVTRLFDGFALVDPCLCQYELPRQEAARRGFKRYLQSMWTVYAVK